MATINQIPMTIMGNIVKDLEPKRTAGGKTVITFRVAQTSSTERNGKWEDGETTFIRCVAYGALADHMIASGIRKGTRVIVTGRFVQRDWQTETGEKRSSFELNADDIGTSIRRSRSPKPTKPSHSRYSSRSRLNLRRPSQSKKRKTIHGPARSRTNSPNHRNLPSEKTRILGPMTSNRSSWALIIHVLQKEDSSNRMSEAANKETMMITVN